jgi:hypothetical protein
MRQHTIVMLAGPDEATNALWHYLARRHGPFPVVMEQPISRWLLLRRRAARIGWLAVLGQMAFILAAGRRQMRRGAGRRRDIYTTAGTTADPIPPEYIHHVQSANAPEALDLLRQFAPRVIVVSATRILSRALLEGLGCPFVNIHAGITPAYRGVHGGYWALASNDPAHCGVTVHFVDAGIDTGGIIAQAPIAPDRRLDHYGTYPALQLAAALPLLNDAVTRLAAGVEVPTIQPPAITSRLWHHPTLWGYLITGIRRGVW